MRTTASNSTVSPDSLAATTLTVFGVVPARVGVLAGRVLQRDDAHADEVGAVDALVALGDDGLDAEQARALGGPVARGAGAVLLARQDDERRAGSGVALGGVVDRRLLAAVGEVAREAALDAVEEEVLQADVGERASDHDLVVAAARAVGVEVPALDAVVGEVLPGGAVVLDGAGRADVVGRDRVAELGEHSGALDVGDRGRVHRHAVEV